LGALRSWAGPAGCDSLQLVRGVIESLTSAPNGATVVVGVDDAMAAHDHAAGRASRRLLSIQAADDRDGRRPPRQHASPAVTLGQVLYHPEAIMLGVTSAETLTAI
jgi:hypothetical protein